MSEQCERLCMMLQMRRQNQNFFCESNIPDADCLSDQARFLSCVEACPGLELMVEHVMQPKVNVAGQETVSRTTIARYLCGNQMLFEEQKRKAL